MGDESLGMRTATPHTSDSLRGRSRAARELSRCKATESNDAHPGPAHYPGPLSDIAVV